MLKANRPKWNLICADVLDFDGRPYCGVDLLAGDVPCPPFSVAGKQLGPEDVRDLFPEALRLLQEIRLRAVMLENIRIFLDPGFDPYHTSILAAIALAGYKTHIRLLQASSFGVPQLRPRVVIVGIRNDENGVFEYPVEAPDRAPVVDTVLYDLMAANGWTGDKTWAARANKIAPTLVDGSKKHGGPDLRSGRPEPAKPRLNWERRW